MAASDLTLPATVATELGGDVVSGDARLPRLISVASGAILRHLGRPQLHYSAAYAESLPGHGRPRLVLGLTPVLDVASVVVDGVTLSADDYELEDADAGLLFRLAGWPWTGVYRGGLPPQLDRDAGSERAAIVVTYEGGWVSPAQAATVGWAGPARSLPYDLEEACVQTVVGLYRRGGLDPNVASEALGDYSVSYRAPNAIVGVGVGVGGIIPDSAVVMLAPYRRLA